MSTEGPLYRPVMRPSRRTSLAGDLGLLLVIVLGFALLQNAVLTITVLSLLALTVLVLRHWTGRLVRRLEGRTRSFRIPRIGRIDYRLTTR